MHEEINVYNIANLILKRKSRKEESPCPVRRYMYIAKILKTGGPAETEQRVQKQPHIQMGTYTIKVILIHGK